MTKEKDKFEIGFTTKPHGYNGEIKFQLEDDYLFQDFQNAKYLHLEVNGKLLPFFVETKREIHNGFLLKFEDYDTKELVSTLASKAAFLEKKQIKTNLNKRNLYNDNYYAACVDFEVFDESNEKLGTINEVRNIAGQFLASLDYNNRSVMVPLNDTFVKSIDFLEKIIVVDLPDGLLDL
ncbi:MAG: 16S rRNA processing protein RimM [Saprospiraceae bacterium]|nr:16S rRNA processing protein RimM [Saprospiraceae bacterium]